LATAGPWRSTRIGNGVAQLTVEGGERRVLLDQEVHVARLGARLGSGDRREGDQAGRGGE
jgi:hypothetical protein